MKWLLWENAKFVARGYGKMGKFYSIPNYPVNDIYTISSTSIPPLKITESWWNNKRIVDLEGCQHCVVLCGECKECGEQLW